MPSTHADSHSPTPYLDLKAVLPHLVEGAKAALKENLIGAYLQGSFAVGDRYSDCDFIIVVDQDLAFGELQAPQRLHKQLLPSGGDPAPVVNHPARSSRRAEAG